MKSAESGKLPLKFVGFAKFKRPPSKLNSNAISENLPLRRSSKMTLGRNADSRSNSQPECVFEDPLETPKQNVPKKLDLGKFAGVFGGGRRGGELNVKIPGVSGSGKKGETDLEISNNLTLRTPLGSAGLRKIEAQSPFKLEGGLSLRQDNEPVITPGRKIVIESPFKEP